MPSSFSAGSGAGQPEVAQRLLVIRFSSFGDIIQAAGVPRAFRERFAHAKIDWLVRSDFNGLLRTIADVDTVISFARSKGLVSLLRLAWEMAGRNSYTHVYDAHNNLRSRIFCAVFFTRLFLRLGASPGPKFVRRPKNRIRRLLFFRFRLPVLPRPFRGAESFHAPLAAAWGLGVAVPDGAVLGSGPELPADLTREIMALKRPWIALAPSAAWAMKRWPEAHWRDLIRKMPEASFVLLGGPTDAFVADIAQAAAPGQAINLAGRVSIEQTVTVLSQVDLAISGDTGILHVADQLALPVLALIGPTAFGYPSHREAKVLEIDLSCKPCSKDGRGHCKNSVYQRCLVEISANRVVAEAREKLQRHSGPEHSTSRAQREESSQAARGGLKR